MLQCYKCYNASPIGLREGCREDWAVTLRRSGGRDEALSGRHRDVAAWFLSGKDISLQKIRYLISHFIK